MVGLSAKVSTSSFLPRQFRYFFLNFVQCVNLLISIRLLLFRGCNSSVMQYDAKILTMETVPICSFSSSLSGNYIMPC